MVLRPAGYAQRKALFQTRVLMPCSLHVPAAEGVCSCDAWVQWSALANAGIEFFKWWPSRTQDAVGLAVMRGKAP